MILRHAKIDAFRQDQAVLNAIDGHVLLTGDHIVDGHIGKDLIQLPDRKVVLPEGKLRIGLVEGMDHGRPDKGGAERNAQLLLAGGRELIEGGFAV